MKVSFVLTVCVVVGGILSGSGCVKHSVVSAHKPGQPASSVALDPSGRNIITEPPPPAQIEVVGSAPGSDFTWIPGHWEWDGHWIWASGRWAKAPYPDATWIPGRWIQRMHGWVWIRGYWRYSIS